MPSTKPVTTGDEYEVYCLDWKNVPRGLDGFSNPIKKLFIRGAVPGRRGTLIEIRDTSKE